MNSTLCFSRSVRPARRSDPLTERSEPHAPNRAHPESAVAHPQLGHHIGDLSAASGPVIARDLLGDAWGMFKGWAPGTAETLSNAAADLTYPPGYNIRQAGQYSWEAPTNELDFEGKPNPAPLEEAVPKGPLWDVGSQEDIPVPTTGGVAFGVGGGAPVGGMLDPLADVEPMPPVGGMMDPLASGGGLGGLSGLLAGLVNPRPGPTDLSPFAGTGSGDDGSAPIVGGLMDPLAGF